MQRGGAQLDLCLMFVDVNLLFGKARQAAVFVGPGAGDLFPGGARRTARRQAFGGDQAQPGTLVGQRQFGEFRRVRTGNFGAPLLLF